VLGVIGNFSRQSLKNAIEPTVYFNIGDGPGGFYSLEMETENVGATVAAVRSLWERTFPNRPFTFFFADEQFDALYRADRQFGRLFNLFALLAVGIACLGVYGLSAFTLYQRTKEIGIRKVLGASTGGILLLFVLDFLRLVLVGFLLASPAVYWLMERWLDGYAFRIDMPLWVFPVAMLATLLIVLATVSVQTVEAATVNPVNSLRRE
jgi:putative ABC transport system permease protein